MVFPLLRALAALLLLCLSLLPARAEAPLRILVMGDSMFSVNRIGGSDVAQALEAALEAALGQALGVEVTDRAMPGARFFHRLPISGAAGMRIPAQLHARDAPWDWVVLNGGGNDILFGAGCAGGTRQIDRLVSTDGSRGAIPALVARIRAGGARVIYAGYLRTPGLRSPIETCASLGDEIDRRLARMAAADPGVWFLPMADLVPEGDRSFHGADLIHPSPKGSQAIARRIAATIAR